MDFEKKFLHPSKSNETILVKWSKGYREVEIWFHDELIRSIKSAKALIKGITFQNDKLGTVKVILSENPYFLNVIVNKIHSKTNLLHPSKNMKGVGNWFVIPAIISVIALISFFATVYDYINSLSIEGYVILLIIFSVTTLLISTIILCRVRKYLPFLISYALTVVIGFLLLYPTIADFHIGYLLMIIPFLIYLTGMTFGLRRVIRFLKHKRIQENLDEDILDN